MASASPPPRSPRRGTAVLIDGLTCGQLRADRAVDANWRRDALAEAGIVAVIPPKSNRRFPAEFDRHTYKWRHLIENFFRETQGKQGDRHALLQNRHKLQCFHRHHRHHHPPEMNVNRPYFP